MWALGILCSLLLLGKVLGHDETLEYSLGEEELLNVTEGVNSFQIRITDHIADTDHLEIVTNYVGDESYYEISDFTLSYTDQPLTWSLSNVTRSNAHLLCATNASDALEMALVVKKVGPEVSVMLVIQIVNITLPIGSTFEEEATLGNSATYLVDPTDGNLSKHGGVVVHVKNTSPDTENVCVIVAFQGNKCPLQNEIDTAKNSDKWMTVLEKGTTTLRQDREPFSGAFYVSVVVLEEDSDCYLPGSDYTTLPDRRKQFQISVEKALSYEEYVGPILVAIIACLSIILGMCFMVSFKELGSFSKLFPREELLLELEPSEEEYYEEISALTQALKFKSNEQRTKWKDTLQTAAQEKDVKTIFETISELLNEDKTRAVANCVDDDEEIRALKEAILLCLPENYRKKRCIEQGLRRLNRDVKLEDMTIRMDEDTNFVWNRSKAYCLLVPLTSMFYFLPSIQFVFLSKMQEQYNGSQDVCYHNFECSHYWGSFSDFNHVISNISYILYGIGFILIVYRKSSKMKTEFAQVPGGLHQFYIFYSMGFALISEGLLSVCYHICPTDYSLQFDTVMMYGICLLCLAKLYQFRHPDGLVNAYSFFYFLSFLLVFQIFPLYSTNWYVFGIFIALYILGTIYVAHDSYYVGLGRLDYIVASTLAQRSLCGCCRTKRGPWPGIIYKKRFILAVIFCCINFLVAIVFTLRKVNDSSKGINEAILPILAVNLALYLVYYLGKKASENFSIEYKAAKAKAKRSQDDVIDGLGDIKIKFPWRSLFSTAMFCGILSLALGLWGGYYYTHGTTSRSHSPAQSRNINRPCAVWDFYDSHDMWHFLSATAIFLAFLSLLTMDDDFIDVPKNQIDVF